MEILVHSWDQLISHLMMMAVQIRARPEQPDLIVAIARGGLVPARILSDLLGLQVASYTVSSYSGLKKNDDEHMSFGIGGRLDGRHVLLIDDVSDTGHTFVRAIKYLNKHGAKKITTAAVFTKPGSIHPPDIFVEETSKWIIFPFDILENLGSVQTKLLAEGMSREDIMRKFVFHQIPASYLFFFSGRRNEPSL